METFDWIPKYAHADKTNYKLSVVGQMAERQNTEITFSRNTFGRMDIWPKDIQPKRQKAERQMTERQIADTHKIERTFGRNDF